MRQSTNCSDRFVPGVMLVISWHLVLRAESPPSLAEVVASGRDVWGEMAMRQPNGASYEFFEPLLPPPRYVHADFRYYPLVLSAPGAKTKARLISNGSGVNLRGGSRSWKDVGTPVVFRVGPDEFRFGDLRDRVSNPELAEGWLPIYEITYRHPYPAGAECADAHRPEADAARGGSLSAGGICQHRSGDCGKRRGVRAVLAGRGLAGNRDGAARSAGERPIRGRRDSRCGRQCGRAARSDMEMGAARGARAACARARRDAGDSHQAADRRIACRSTKRLTTSIAS